MRVKQPADFDYKRYRIGPRDGLRATTVALTWEQDLKWTRQAGGMRLFSKLLHAEAARLRRDGYTGTLSAAVRKAVQAKLNQI
jgi:hypothetical protein